MDQLLCGSTLYQGLQLGGSQSHDKSGSARLNKGLRAVPTAGSIQLGFRARAPGLVRVSGAKPAETERISFHYRQRLWLRLYIGVNVDDQLWLRLNPIPIRNCNPGPSANPSPCRNTNTNPNPNRPTTPLLTLTDPLTSK